MGCGSSTRNNTAYSTGTSTTLASLRSTHHIGVTGQLLVFKTGEQLTEYGRVKVDDGVVNQASTFISQLDFLV